MSLLFSFIVLHSLSLSSSAVRSRCKLSALHQGTRKYAALRHSLASHTWPRVKPDAAISVARLLLTDFHVTVLTFLWPSSRRDLLSIDSAFGAESSCPRLTSHSRSPGLMPGASTQPASRRTTHHGDCSVLVHVQGLRSSEPGGRCFLLLQRVINSGFPPLPC